MLKDLEIKLIEAQALTVDEWEEILDLCNRAYQEELEPLFKTFVEPVHVVGRLDDSIVSHAMWVTRWFETGDGRSFRTAYGEMGNCGEEKRLFSDYWKVPKYQTTSGKSGCKEIFVKA